MDASRFTPLSALTLLAGLLALGSSHCGDKPSAEVPAPQIPTEELGKVPAFPDPAQLIRVVTSAPDDPEGVTPADVDATAPSIASVRLVGPAHAPIGLDVTFDRAMERFEGAVSATGSDILTVAPAIEGTLAWRDARTLRLDAAEALPAATRFVVRALGGVRSATGIAAASGASGAVESARLDIRFAPYGSIDYPSTRQPGGSVAVELNLAVDLAEVRRQLEVLVGTEGELRRGAAARARYQLGPLPSDGPSPRHGFVLTPEDGFEVGAWYQITIPTTLAPIAGPLGLAQARTLVLRGPERLAPTMVDCGVLGCIPGATWTVWLNNPRAPDAPPDSCLRVSPRLDLGPVTGEQHTLSFTPRRVAPGQRYEVSLTATCRDIYGTTSAAGRTITVATRAIPARVRMAEGVGIVEPPVAGEAIALPLSVSGTGALTFRRARLTAETLPGFLGSSAREWGNLDLALEEATEERVHPPGAGRELTSMPVLLDDFLGPDQRGVVFVEVIPERPGPWGEITRRRALVQVSDTGLVVKSGPRDTLVWASSIRSAAPLEGVSITLLSAAGAPLWSGPTDSAGIARGPGGQGLAAAPRFVLASAGGDDLAFVDVDRWETRVDGYRFGLHQAWGSERAAELLRGVVFTERGVYRAGETVHLKAFGRADRGERLEPMAGAEVVVKTTDATGDLLDARTVALGPHGDLSFALALPDDAALGRYSVEVDASDGQLAGTIRGAFRVEAYRPAAFEVIVKPRAERERIVAGLEGRYLHGAPMAEAPVSWFASATQASFQPAGYEDFRFTPPRHDTWWEPSEDRGSFLASGSGVLDGEGRLEVELPTATIELARGPRTVLIEAEVRDVDEQVITGRGRVRLDPGAFYLGVSRGEGVVEAGSRLTARVVSVTPEGAATGGVDATVSLVRRTWESERELAAGGGHTWVTRRVDEVVATESVVTAQGAPVEVALTIDRPGYYELIARATDDAGREILAGTTWWAWGGGDAAWARSDDERLELVLARDRFEVGETARVLVPSPWPEGHALVTVEREGVIWQQVVPVEGATPVLDVPITEAMQPNAYIAVALVRGRGEGEDAERPATRFGYASITVDTQDKRLAVELTPERARYEPGERVRTRVAVHDHQGRPAAGQVTFWAVDEGVLQLTGYRVPDPLAALYESRPIAVQTSDARRRLWESIVPTDDGYKADWGGGGEEGDAELYRSAFATTPIFLPDVDVGPSGVAEVAFDLPDNIGAYRIMALAVSEPGRFGRAETRVEVSKPLLLRPALPRFVSSGDAFEARVVVQALGPEGAGPVEVRIDTDGPVRVTGTDAITLALQAGETRAVSFSVEATAPGTASFGFRVRSQAQARAGDAVRVEIPVSHPVSTRVAVETGQVGRAHGIDGVAARRVSLPDWIAPDAGGLVVELASSAMGELLPGLSYLIQYPYGCVEQTTSTTLPLLALHRLLGEVALPGLSAADVLERAQMGLDRIRGMQTYDGGLAYWSGGDEPHPWGSAYGGLALVEAARMDGLTVPSEAVERLAGYMRSVLHGKARAGEPEWAEQLYAVEPFAAYVLAVAGEPDHGYHARLFEGRDRLPAFARALLAMAVAEADGDRAMLDTLIEELAAGVDVAGGRAMVRRTDTRYYATMDSDVRTAALVLMALHRAAPGHELAPKLARGILAERRNGRWLSTQENAFAILALSEHFAQTERADARYLATVRLGDAVLLREEMRGAGLTAKRVRIPMGQLSASAGELLTIEREGDEAPLYFTLRFEYVPRVVPMDAVDRGFALTREYLIAEGPDAGRPATTVRAGQLVEVRISVRTPRTRRYVAIDDPLPAGLEAVLTDLETSASRLAQVDRRDWRARTVFSHVEQHDERVSIFANHMPEGTWVHTYLARATTAGSFLAPAAFVHEMYRPDTFGQSEAVPFAVQ